MQSCGYCYQTVTKTGTKRVHKLHFNIPILNLIKIRLAVSSHVRIVPETSSWLRPARLSARTSYEGCASSGRISVKFDTGDFYEDLSLILKRG
jgi:hypothetical protein